MSRIYYVYKRMDCGKEVAGLSRRLNGTRCDCGEPRLPTKEISKKRADELNQIKEAKAI